MFWSYSNTLTRLIVRKMGAKKCVYANLEMNAKQFSTYVVELFSPSPISLYQRSWFSNLFSKNRVVLKVSTISKACLA